MVKTLDLFGILSKIFHLACLQSVNCKTVSHEVCIDEGKNETQVCQNVPKTECQVKTDVITKSIPETEVTTLGEPIKLSNGLKIIIDPF